MFGMLMDDDRDDGGAAQFGINAAQRRRIMGARSGRAFRGYGDDPQATWPGSPYASDPGYYEANPISTSYVDPTTGAVVSGSGSSGGTTSDTSTGTNWWDAAAKALGLTAAVAGDVTKIVVGASGSCPAGSPYYSSVTRQCYTTLAAAQAASGQGNPGLLVVGVLGIGLLAWLAKG